MGHANQRWCEGEARWAFPRHRCDVKLLDAAPISYAEASEFIKLHHYSGSYPSVRYRVGFFFCGRLSGVATFGIPAGPAVLQAWTGFGQEEAIELNRFVLLEELGYNAESHCLKLARRLLKQALPGLKALLAFSDPVLRTDLSGRKVMPGHTGTIYQATNAAYRGRSGAQKLLLDDDGKTISKRLLQKIRRQESGHDYATRRLLDAGVSPPEQGEPPGAWLKRVLPSFRRLAHPGNHGYVWALDRKVSYSSCLPYPKLVGPIQLGLF